MNSYRQETGGYTFHGRHIFDAVMSDLALNFGLLEASHIILTGGSAGAQGVMYNCDNFSSWVWQTNPGLDVRCVANAPEFYPAEVHTGQYSKMLAVYNVTRLRQRTATPAPRTTRTSSQSSGLARLTREKHKYLNF